MVQAEAVNEEGRTTGHRRRKRQSRRSRVTVTVLAVAAGIGGALAGAHPTGTLVVDPLYSAGFAVLVTVTCSLASRSTWLVLSAVAVGMSRTWLLVPAVVDLGVAFAAVFARRRTRRVGAAVGALASQIILRWPTVGFQGLTAIVAVAAVTPCLISAYRGLGRRGKRRVRLSLGLGGAAVVFFALPVAIGALLARSPVATGILDTKAALASAGGGASTIGTAQLRQAASAFATASSRTAGWWTKGGRLVPIVAQQGRALGGATNAAHDLTTSAQSEESTVNLRDLGYHDGQIDLSRVRVLAKPLSRLDGQLAAAQQQLATLGSPWLVGPIRSRLGSLRSAVDQAHRSTDLASKAVRIAPGLLGGDGPRHYFVAFETPAESRGLGGFIGAFGELTASQGRLSLTRSGPINALNNVASGSRHINGLPGYLARYGGFQPNNNFQDLTYSPDLPTVSTVIAQMYPQSGGDTIDGVLVLDPIGLAPLLRFTGPLAVPGLSTPLSSDNAAQILLKTQYEDFTGTTQAEIDRHDFLQGALTQAFDKLVHGSLPSPQTLSADLDPGVRQGHLLFWSMHPSEQPLLRDVSLAGAFPSTKGGDLLAVTTQNAANNKIDAYLARTVSDAVTYDPGNGRVDATVTVALHNAAPGSGLPPDVIGSYQGSGLPPGTNRTWMSVYSPLALTDSTVDGRPMPLVPNDELGVHAYSTHINIPPGGTSTVVLHLHGTVSAAHSYVLSVRQQPMIIPDRDDVVVSAADGWATHGTSTWAPGPIINQSRRLAFSRNP